MQEPEAHFAKARFARRHLSKMAGIGLAAVIARLSMPKPAQAHDHDHDGRGWGWGDPACFLKGTRIRTASGERAVEDLAAGDLLPTRFNGLQPIQWIGRYRYTRSEMSKPWVRAVLPVRIARSAFATNVPHSDLYLSQAHCIFVDGELVCVGSVINGATIALHEAGDRSELEYYHIKMQSHDVIDAEGAPCDTLLHVDENAMNFAEYLRTYGTPSEVVRPCAPIRLAGNRSRLKSHLRSALSPLVDRREKIDIIRDRLEDRALSMG
jgi:hypothetical protein